MCRVMLCDGVCMYAVMYKGCCCYIMSCDCVCCDVLLHAVLWWYAAMCGIC